MGWISTSLRSKSPGKMLPSIRRRIAPILCISGQYDVICANIVADVIIRLCPSLRRFLQPGGYFLASGIIDERSVEVEKAIRDCGMYIIDRREEDGWVALRCLFAEE